MIGSDFLGSLPPPPFISVLIVRTDDLLLGSARPVFHAVLVVVVEGGGGLVSAGHVFRFNKKRWNVLTFWLCCLVLLSVGRVGPTLPGI